MEKSKNYTYALYTFRQSRPISYNCNFIWTDGVWSCNYGNMQCTDKHLFEAYYTHGHHGKRHSRSLYLRWNSQHLHGAFHLKHFTLYFMHSFSYIVVVVAIQTGDMQIYWLPICLYYGTLFLFNSDNGIITTSVKKNILNWSSQAAIFDFSLIPHRKAQHLNFLWVIIISSFIWPTLVSPVIWVFTNSSM